MFATTVLDMSDFPTRHPYSLGIWQNQIERIMAAWIAELPVRIYYGCEVTGFAQDDTGVDVELSDDQSLRAQYLVGCDGGRSVIRKAAGIEFPGWDPTKSNLIAEVETTEEPELGIRHDAIGVHGLGRLEYEVRDGEVVYMDGGPVRVMVTERQLGPSSEPTLRDLSEALITVYGTDFGIHNPTWISRFTDMTRQAAAYRAGRVLLAGDSAHVHYPAGGQGLSLGVQDAVNLGWKLAQVVNGTSPESLLDTYQDERHPVAARALQHTMAQTALQRPDERIKALVDVVSELASMDEPRKRLAGIISGLDIHYDLGEGHPLLGRRMPDLDLVTADGPLRVFELLHDARPVLLNLGEPGGFDITPWAHRVQLIDAKYVGTWELPVLGEVTAPTAMLIRPDGYVAWVGDLTQLGLADALTTWFGPPTAA
jgi:2-polyprenyl-6-methoxyphenol hydroxylase-like FAD-dependent oxidoreductase